MESETAKALTVSDLRHALQASGVPLDRRVAVAVSGGPDSLCLALLAAELCDVVCLTVDHGLRAEARAETDYVADLMAAQGVSCVKLAWEGDKPSANLQAEARAARYGLLGDWCRDNGVGYLLTAHHQDDQAETLLLRLARGSGVYGLAAMAPTSHLPDNEDVLLVRPFLGFPKVRLVQTLKERDIRWVDDPSNKSSQFDRVRVREFLANPPLDGFRADRLAGTAARLRRTRDALEYYERQWLASAAIFHEDGRATLNARRLDDAPLEIVLRGLASLCRKVSGERYVPRMEKLERLLADVRSPDFSGCTLYGVQFIALGAGGVMLVRELRATAGRQLLGAAGCWDNRFDISAKGDIAGLEIGPLGQNGWEQACEKWPALRQLGMPHAARLVLPAVFDKDTVIAIPHLNVADAHDFCVSLSLKTHGWPKK